MRAVSENQKTFGCELKKTLKHFTEQRGITGKGEVLCVCVCVTGSIFLHIKCSNVIYWHLKEYIN